MINILTSAEFDDKIKSGFSLVDFYATWCGPCKMISPIVEEISSTYGNKISFYKYDVDSDKDIPSRYDIMSIPTLILFKNGEFVSKITGMMPKEDIEEWINKNIK